MSVEVKKFFPELTLFFHASPYKAFIKSKVGDVIEDLRSKRKKINSPSGIEEYIDKLFTEQGLQLGVESDDLIAILYGLQKTEYVSTIFTGEKQTEHGKVVYATFKISMNKIKNFMIHEKEKIDQLLSGGETRYVCERDVLCKGCYGYELTEAYKREFVCENGEKLDEMPEQMYESMMNTAKLCKKRLERLLVRGEGQLI